MSHVDTNAITHVSLCSGYGGIDLGLKRAIGRSLRTVAYVEVESFAVANLVAKASQELLDEAPVWSDLRSFPWGKFHGLVDILSGGYPCQPFSAAGKRLGAEDPRHLWPHISAGIALMRPSVCFFENVEGHISLGLPDVIEDLAGLGYTTTWGIFSASEVGAPHQRKRVFMLAYDQQQGLERLREYCPAVCWPDERLLAGNGGCGEELALTSSLGSAAGIPRPHHGHEGIAGGGELADSAGDRLNGSLFDQEAIEQAEGNAIAGGCAWPSRPGEPQHAWEPPRVVGNAAECDGVDASRIRRALERQSRRRVDSDPSVEGGTMGNPNSPRPQERTRQQRAGLQGADADGGEAADREAFASLGRDLDGALPWARLSELSGLSDQELAEIRHWMVASDNRTDELRLLGNGVVPATAERAFRVLIEELTR